MIKTRIYWRAREIRVPCGGWADAAAEAAAPPTPEGRLEEEVCPDGMNEQADDTQGTIGQITTSSTIKR